MRRVLRTLFALAALALLAILVLAIVALLGTAVTAVQRASTAGLRLSAHTPPAVVVPYGSTAHTAGWDFRILSVRRAGTLLSYGVPEHAQGVFVLLRLHIINRQSATSPLNSWDFTLHDAQGRSYDTSAGAPQYGFMSVTVQPSLGVDQNLLFDVAPDARALCLRVQDGTLLAL